MEKSLVMPATEKEVPEFIFPLASLADIQKQLEHLAGVSVSTYTREVLQPVEFSGRVLPEDVIRSIARTSCSEQKSGPLYTAIGEIGSRRVAFVAHSRSSNNGVFQPEHHRAVEAFIGDAEQQCLPVICFIDTPGADAGEGANYDLQAHSISALIARFTSLKVPTIGIIWGKAYSGGAIPFASTNRLFMVEDALFNTIQPQGLAAIARRQKLSWQACAQIVGLSAYELAAENIVDGVLKFSPNSLSSREINHFSDWLKDQLEDLDREIERFPATNKSPEFAVACRQHRWQVLNERVHCTEGYEPRMGNCRKISGKAFCDEEGPDIVRWLSLGFPVHYELDIKPLWQAYRTAPETKRKDLVDHLSFELAAYLHRKWGNAFPEYVAQLKAHWVQAVAPQLENCTGIEDLIMLPELRDLMCRHFEAMTVIESLYQVVIQRASEIAAEYSHSKEKKLSRTTLESILRQACEGVEGADVTAFLAWVVTVRSYKRLESFIDATNQWKQKANPRMDDVLLISIAYIIKVLLPQLHGALQKGEVFDGGFFPLSIGRTKNFWHRLTRTSRNLRVQAELNANKAQLQIAPAWFLQEYVCSFNEFYENLETSDPRQFPGFAESILKCQGDGGRASGLIVGQATLLNEGIEQQLGLFVSNSLFQAGAFDMSSAVKLSRLLEHCMARKLSVIGFIASGGMQTKEGPAALFSMAIVNEAINRYCEVLPGRLMVVGFGDCTGGAQASLVTHPEVRTAYFAGTNMPFAGQVVVPQHLPLQSTLSNYLNSVPGAMDALISHPLLPGLDAKIRAIDPESCSASYSLDEAIALWLSGAELKDLDSSKSREVDSKHYGSIEKVLIHARGCTAARLIDAAHQLGKQVVLVQSDPDMQSGLASRLYKTDQLICLGGATPDESYLNAESVLRIAELQGVDAIHPGIGFLSENAEFARQCNQRGFIFIGPDAASIALMGDKARAISTAAGIGLPTVPGSQGAVAGSDHALSLARDIGYPLLIKSSFGGGGKGIAVVYSDDELIDNFSRLSREAENAFGNGELYLERYLEQVRHIEVQILRDSNGNCFVLGVRDCSVQRNRQKIVEESGEYVLSGEQEALLTNWSQQISDHINYVGAGTVEFLYDLSKQCFYFMEMNTRLQVEHPVTEFTSGIDIVEQQFAVAEGLSLSSLKAGRDGHSIELRINAERVSCGDKMESVPSTGVLTRFQIPERPWARVLAFSREGCEITPFYDSLIAQLVVHGSDRQQAILRMRELLDEVVIQGVDTNMPLLKLILEDDAFASGNFGTDYLDGFFQRQTRELHQQSGRDALKHNATHYEMHGDEIFLKSPSSGVVYLSPSPGERQFVYAGHTVQRDDAVFLLEVMKIFMPVKLAGLLGDTGAEKYQIVHVNIQDAAYVQAGDVVMVLKRAEA